MHWLLLSLLLLLISGSGNESNAQEVGRVKTTVNTQEIQKTVSESTKDSISLTPEDQAILIRHLLETIKEMKAENEALRLENEKERMKAADKLNAIEARLAKIEKKTALNIGSDSGTPLVRAPRYDSNYNSIYFEPRGRIRDRNSQSPSTRQ